MGMGGLNSTRVITSSLKLEPSETVMKILKKGEHGKRDNPRQTPKVQSLLSSTDIQSPLSPTNQSQIIG